MEEIIIATSNKGKVREAQEILKKFKVIPMSEIGVNIDVEGQLFIVRLVLMEKHLKKML